MAKTWTSIMRGVPMDIYIAAAATATPVTGVTISWASYTELGYMDGGLTLEMTQEHWEATADQTTMIVKRELTAEGLSVTVNLSESVIAHLQYAHSGAAYTAGAVAGTDSNELDLGGLATTNEYTLGFQAVGANLDPADAHEDVVVWIPRVTPMGAVGQPFLQDGVRVIPCQWSAMGSMGLAAGKQLMTIYETTTAAP